MTAEPDMERPLRIAAVVDGPEPQCWATHILRKILAEPGLTLSAVLLDDRQATPGSIDPVFTAYRAVDVALFRTRPGVENPTDRHALPPGAPAISSLSAWQGGDDGTPYPVDVLLHLAPGSPPTALAARARHGLWHIEHGKAGQGDDWGAAELAARRTTIESRLLAIAPDSGDARVLAVATGPVRDYSLIRTRTPAYWRGAALVLKHLRLTARGQDPQASIASVAHSARAIPAKAPLRATAAILRRLLHRPLYRDDWLVGIRPIQDDLLPGSAAHSAPFREIAPPRGCYYADPFPFSRDESEHLFVEEFDRKLGRGRIVHLDIGEDLSATGRSVVLDQPYHLSFPFVFEWEGEVFMIPETARNRTIDLYRADRFPAGWSFERTLLRDVSAVDTVLHEQDGSWWLFTSIANGGDSGETLSVFHADTPFGPWQPHPANPVVSDVRCARAAGRLARLGEALIRPAQDGSERYGGRIAMRRVDLLTRDDYQESDAGSIEPVWRPGLLGTHTWNRSQRIEAVDGDLRRFRIPFRR